METLQQKFINIKQVVADTPLSERDSLRIVEKIKRREWKDGEYVDIEPATNELRPFISTDGDLCVFMKGKRRYGYRLEIKPATIDLELVSKGKKPAKALWQAGIENFIKRTEASGLWGELNKKARLCLELGYETIRQAYEAYDRYENNLSYDENNKRRVAEVKAIDERLITEKGGVDTDILWHLSYIPKIKKMNFGKYINEDKLAEIAQAMKEKKALNMTGRTSYDVSFEYKPELNKAWYSEEFRGCGNGHYYLALDATHAWHYEDD